tara:strand:+ start:266 stop:544 length:279 start_codon:yes stop_codon:yes gene_type:complete
MNRRSVSIIVLTLFFGTFFGTLLGELLAWILPESVVRDFFLKSVNFTLGGYRGEPFLLDLIMFSIQFGLKVTFNFTSIIGFATAYYFLRYFR